MMRGKAVTAAVLRAVRVRNCRLEKSVALSILISFPIAMSVLLPSLPQFYEEAPRHATKSG
jgi:hypothetical protein